MEAYSLVKNCSFITKPQNKEEEEDRGDIGMSSQKRYGDAEPGKRSCLNGEGFEEES